MSGVRRENTEPEQMLRRELWHRGHRYRLHHPTPAGKPDLVFLGQKVAIFVDGCFWHGCPRHYVRPRTRTEFWDAKLSANRERDQRQTQKLRQQGWLPVRVWECEIKEDVERVSNRIGQILEARG